MGGGERLRDALQPGGIAIDEGYSCAGIDERPGDGRANPSGGPRDERPSAFQAKPNFEATREAGHTVCTLSTRKAFGYVSWGNEFGMNTSWTVAWRVAPSTGVFTQILSGSTKGDAIRIGWS